MILNFKTAGFARLTLTTAVFALSAMTAQADSIKVAQITTISGGFPFGDVVAG